MTIRHLLPQSNSIQKPSLSHLGAELAGGVVRVMELCRAVQGGPVAGVRVTQRMEEAVKVLPEVQVRRPRREEQAARVNGEDPQRGIFPAQQEGALLTMKTLS